MLHHPTPAFGPPSIPILDPALLASSSDGDFELLRLGVLFDAAATAQRAVFDSANPSDAKCQRAQGKAGRIARSIQAIPATTLDGLLVKIRVASWCHSGEPFDDRWLKDAGMPDGAQTTDARFVLSILRDLAAINERSPQRSALQVAS